MRALLEQGCLPRIIAGSSVGSIVAAIVAVHTDVELHAMYTNMDNFNLSFFGNTTSLQSFQHLLTKGTLQDISFLIERLRALLGDLTFIDVFERTGTPSRVRPGRPAAPSWLSRAASLRPARSHAPAPRVRLRPCGARRARRSVRECRQTAPRAQGACST